MDLLCISQVLPWIVPHKFKKEKKGFGSICDSMLLKYYYLPLSMFILLRAWDIETGDEGNLDLPSGSGEAGDIGEVGSLSCKLPLTLSILWKKNKLKKILDTHS